MKPASYFKEDAMKVFHDEHNLAFVRGGMVYLIRGSSISHSFPIKGDMKALYSYNSRYCYICTDAMVYFINADVVIIINNINNNECDWAVAPRMGRKCILLTNADTGDTMYVNMNGHKTTLNPTLISTLRSEPIEGDIPGLMVTNSFNWKFVFPPNMIPDQIFYVSDEMYCLIDNTFYVCKGKNKLVLITHKFDIKEIFVNNATNNKIYSSFEKFHVVDTEGNIWHIRVDAGIGSFVLAAQYFFVENEQIIEIIAIKSMIYVRSTHRFSIFDTTIIIGNPIGRLSLDSSSDLQIVLVDRLERICLKYRDAYYLLTNNVYSPTSINAENSDLITIRNKFCYKILHPISDVIFSNGNFYKKNDTSVIHETGVDVFSLIGTNNKIEVRRLAVSHLQDRSLYMDIKRNPNEFDTLFDWLIGCRFDEKAHVKYTNLGKLVASGTGVTKENSTRIGDYISSKLMTPECMINLLHSFWTPINSFYFGKLMAYNNSNSDRFDLKFDLGLAVTLYMSVTKKIIDISDLAPFHAHFNEEEFNRLRNMDDIYKTDVKEFSKLNLGYESFNGMVLGKCTGSVASDLDSILLCVDNIAKGMISFDKDIANLNFTSFYLSIFGEPKWDRYPILIKMTVPDPKIRTFIDTLTDEEFRMMIINITGYANPNEPVRIVLVDNTHNYDFAIQACSNLLCLKSTLLQSDNYAEVLKDMLCVRDTHMLG
jgi:hypothetical protein